MFIAGLIATLTTSAIADIIAETAIVAATTAIVSKVFEDDE